MTASSSFLISSSCIGMLCRSLRRFKCGESYFVTFKNISSRTIETAYVRYMSLNYKLTLTRKTFISFFVVALKYRLYIRGEASKIRLHIRGEVP